MDPRSTSSVGMTTASVSTDSPAAVHILARAAAGESVEAEAVVMPTELVERGSTRPAVSD